LHAQHGKTVVRVVEGDSFNAAGKHFGHAVYFIGSWPENGCQLQDRFGVRRFNAAFFVGPPTLGKGKKAALKRRTPKPF
jgi:hypothetical protein